MLRRRGEHRRVREAAHVQRHDPRLVLPALIPEGGEQRLPRQRSQRRVRLADVHAAELVVARGVDVDRADAFDRRFARFALDAEHARKRGVGLEGSRAVRLFEAEQDLMPAAGRIAEVERHQRAAHVVAVDRPAGDGGQLVARRQLHLQRSRLALHDRRSISDTMRRSASPMVMSERMSASTRASATAVCCVVSRTDQESCAARPATSVSSTLGAAVRGGAADDQARLDADVGRIAGQVDDRANRYRPTAAAGRTRHGRVRSAARWPSRSRRRRAPARKGSRRDCLPHAAAAAAVRRCAPRSGSVPPTSGTLTAPR